MKKFLGYIILILIIFIIILLYGRFVGVNGLNTKEYTIYDKIDDSYDGLKIVHFSDLHYKKVITENRVIELIKEINYNNPDIVFFTGDLLDKDYDISQDDINFLIDELSLIKSKYGVYAVMGDNDSLKKETLKNIYIQSNITLLDNSYNIIKNEDNVNIFIGGVGSFIYEEANIEEVIKSIDKIDNIDYKILLMHEGDYIDYISNYNFNLVLAGHSLNGSINIPVIKKLFLEDKAKKYYKDYYKIDNTSIYISNGIGVSNINFRLFNRPSINVYRIKSK